MVQATTAGAVAHVRFEGTCSTRLGRKTPQHVWTLFGQVCLRRVGYRSTSKDGSPTLFPLVHSLGLIHGASPVLVSRNTNSDTE